MSDDESEDEKMKTLMAHWQREENSDDEKPKKKTKKKKKKKEKEGEDAEEEVEESGEKKDKKKKKKSKDKEKDKVKEKKEKEKDKSKSKSKESKDVEPSSPRKSKKKTKEKEKDKERDKDKEKEKDKKKGKDKDKEKKSKKKKKDVDSITPEPLVIAPPAPVVLDPIDYVEDDDGNASETSGDRKMKELLQQWDEDGDESNGSSSSEEEEEEPEPETFEERRMTKAELGLEDNALDHIVLAAPNFDEAMKEFETMTGIKPSIVGSLKGLGTKTARVGLDNQAYIEIIAPDLKKPGPIGDQLMNLEEGALVPIHYAIRQTDLSDLADDYVPNELGYDPDRIAMFRAAPDGTPRKWEMLFMHGHFHGGTVPYFVDWGDCEHPIGSIAQVGSLKSFVVSCPAGSKVSKLLKGMKGITVVDGELGLEFSFGSPEGTITFSGDKPPGIKFPGYEEKKPPGAVDAEEDDSNEDEEDEESEDENEESEAVEGEDDDDEANEVAREDQGSEASDDSDGDEDVSEEQGDDEAGDGSQASGDSDGR